VLALRLLRTPHQPAKISVTSDQALLRLPQRSR
jgi:hypothetical protein